MYTVTTTRANQIIRSRIKSLMYLYGKTGAIIGAFYLVDWADQKSGIVTLYSPDFDMYTDAKLSDIVEESR